MTHVPYPDRSSAGRELASHLLSYHGIPGLLVLALPRGGVPVAFEVAKALGADLDILVVRKLGLPGQPELAMGAIASGGISWENSRVTTMAAIPARVFKAVEDCERKELLRREQTYRGDHPQPTITGRCVLLVDDGLATGSTMRAAIRAVRIANPARIVVAVPVAPPDTVASLLREADDVVCPATPSRFYGVGQFYQDFPQLDDQHVRDLLHQAWQTSTASPP